MVAGPPVEMQVRVLDWSYSRLVTLGEPEDVDNVTPTNDIEIP